MHEAPGEEANRTWAEELLAPVPSWGMFPESARPLFQAFRTPKVGWNLIVDQNVFLEKVLPGSVIRPLTPEEMEHYREPFRDPSTRKPVWRWPNELPIEGEPADVVKVVDRYNQWLQETELP